MTIFTQQQAPVRDEQVLDLNVETLKDLTADQWAHDVRGGAKSMCTYEQSGCN